MPRVVQPIPFPDGVCRTSFGHWFSGFSDGEATFVLRSIIQKPGPRHPRPRKSYQALFRIALRADDVEVLRLSQSFLGVGRLTLSDNVRSKVRNAKPVAIYCVTNTADIASVIVPHFTAFPLRAKKATDFAVFAEGVRLLHSVAVRPAVWLHRGGKIAGHQCKWTDEERTDIESLIERLSSSRVYAAPLLFTPPR